MRLPIATAAAALSIMKQQEPRTRAGLEPGCEDRSSLSVVGNSEDSRLSDVMSAGSSLHHRDTSAGPTVTLSHDLIGEGLEDARDAWTRDADPKALRRALLELLRRLEAFKTWFEVFLRVAKPEDLSAASQTLDGKFTEAELVAMEEKAKLLSHNEAEPQ